MSQLKVDNITDELGTGAPNFPNGLTGSELTQAQATDDTSTVFGTVSGQRLNQETKASLNVSGAAPMFACRAFVNFDGTGTVAIRESGNVSSITDNGRGDYTVNFATAMPDAHYSVAQSHDRDGSFVRRVLFGHTSTSSGVRLTIADSANSTIDVQQCTVAIFR